MVLLQDSRTLFLAFLMIFSAFGSVIYADEAQEKPRCGSNRDCVKAGMVGACQNPGQPNSKCIYQEAVKVEATVILPKDCQTCVLSSQALLNGFKSLFPGLSVEILDSDTERAKKFIQDLHIEMLPAYALSKQVERDPNFLQIQSAVDLIGEYYYIRPSFAGVSYFVGRQVESGKLDLFVALTQYGSDSVLKLAKEIIDQKKDKISFNLHFIGKQDEEQGIFLNPAGTREVNEDKLFACVDKNYPQKTWDYLFCRTKNVDSLWWEDCLSQNGMDAQKMRTCTESKETEDLLKAKNKLADELQVFYSPVFLLDNVEVLTVTEQTTAADIMKVMDSRIQAMSKSEMKQ